VPLTDPLVEHSVGLVAVDRDPVSPLVLAAFDCAALPSHRRYLGSIRHYRRRISAYQHNRLDGSSESS
jgi:hypothetical protein